MTETHLFPIKPGVQDQNLRNKEIIGASINVPRAKMNRRTKYLYANLKL